MTPLLLLLLAAPDAAAQEAGSARHHVAQARQFVKNKWYEDAAAEIEKALAAPGGAENFDAHWLGAQVYYEVVDIDRAVTLAERAAALAPDAEARERAADYAEFLRRTFGAVEVTGPDPNLRSRLQIEPASVIFDADLKRLVNKVALRARDGVTLPARISLPAGDYLVNGVPVTVPAGGAGQVRLELGQLGSRGLAALQVTRLEIGAGTGVLFGERVENLGTGAAFELSLTVPVGPLLLGAVGTWDLRSYRAAGSETTTDLQAWGGGVRVGREFALGGPVGVRPSVGVRYGLVPGIGFGCDEADGALTCALPDADAEVEIYALGRAVTPFAELSIEYREAGRTTALGVGVKAVVEQHVGTVESPGEALLHDAPDATPLPYDAAPATWSATGLRLLANVSLAF